MKTTQILFLSAASLLVLAGCSGNKKSGEPVAEEGSEQFTLTVDTDSIIRFTLDAESLTIDWGDGTTETYEPCIGRSVTHAYGTFAAHTVTALTKNLTSLEINGADFSAPGTRVKPCTLDVSRCPALTSLLCNHILLATGLDVSKNTKLASLNCLNTQLTDLDVSNNTELKFLDCVLNSLVDLDVSKNIFLRELYCNRNELTDLDVSKNDSLTRLGCSNNYLEKLDVSHSLNLSSLGCNNNQLTDLKLKKGIKLKELDCSNNRLSTKTINSVLKDLPPLEEYAAENNLINIAGNPCKGYDASIATKKGWLFE